MKTRHSKWSGELRLHEPPPAVLVAPGFEYVYNVLAVDADAGESLTFMIAEARRSRSWTPEARSPEHWASAISEWVRS